MDLLHLLQNDAVGEVAHQEQTKEEAAAIERAMRKLEEQRPPVGFKP